MERDEPRDQDEDVASPQSSVEPADPYRPHGRSAPTPPRPPRTPTRRRYRARPPTAPEAARLDDRRPEAYAGRCTQTARPKHGEPADDAPSSASPRGGAPTPRYAAPARTAPPDRARLGGTPRRGDLPVHPYPGARRAPRLPACPRPRSSPPAGRCGPRDRVATTRHAGARPGAARSGWSGCGPGRREQERRHDLATVRRTSAACGRSPWSTPRAAPARRWPRSCSAMTFGQNRGGYVLAWDNNETQGTLGMRAQQDFHARTVRDLLRDLDQFRRRARPGRRPVAVRARPGARACSTCSPPTSRPPRARCSPPRAFREIREVVGRFYKLILVDTGNNVRAENWQAAVDATDQLVITMSARNDSAETAARLLDHLEQTGRQRARAAGGHRRDDAAAPQGRQPARDRAALRRARAGSCCGCRTTGTSTPAPRCATRGVAGEPAGWLRVAAAVAEGL